MRYETPHGLPKGNAQPLRFRSNSPDEEGRQLNSRLEYSPIILDDASEGRESSAMKYDDSSTIQLNMDTSRFAGGI